MAILLTDSIRVGQQKPIDDKYYNGLSPYTSTSDVNTNVLSSVRYRGLTVNINGVEYWYKDGILDSNLVVKSVDLSGYVPYTGATTDVNLGTYNLTTNTVILPKLTSDPTSINNAAIIYSKVGAGGYDVPFYMGQDGRAFQLGNQIVIAFVNNSGSTINAGTPICINSSSIVIPARADTPQYPALGITLETIINGASGRYTVNGSVKGIDLTAFSNGDKIYLGTTGGLVNTPPPSGTVTQYIGVVGNNTNDANSSLLVLMGTPSPSSVTSVGLSMPSAFSVANSPITGSGTLAVTALGTSSQYIRGDGSLAAYNPGTGGGGASQVFYFNGGTPSGVAGYQQMSTTAITGTSSDFSISSNGYIASFLTDVGSPNQLNIPAGNWNFEIYFNSSSAGGSPNFYVELYKYNGSFTLIATSSTNPEYITNGTSVDLYTTAVAVPATTLLTTDRLAVRVYVNNSGRTITMHTQDSNLSEVITTFSTGITALNGLTSQVQTFTNDTNVTITSSGTTHTLGWTGTLADSRIASASNWNTAYTDRYKWDGGSTGLTASTGRTSLGLGTFAVKDYPTWTTGTPFVKMTAAGTFSLDTNTYLTANQSISLTGAVTGTGATSIVTTLANGVVGIANHSATGTPSSSTYLRGDNTWATVNVSPGGSDTQIQFNNSGSFAGDSNLIWDNTYKKLILGTTSSASAPSFQITQPTTGIGTIVISSGTVTGTGTQFQNTFKLADTFTCNSVLYTVTAIASNTSMTVSPGTSQTSQGYTLTGGARFSVFGNGNTAWGTPGTGGTSSTMWYDARYGALNIGTSTSQGSYLLNVSGNVALGNLIWNNSTSTLGSNSASSSISTLTISCNNSNATGNITLNAYNNITLTANGVSLNTSNLSAKNLFWDNSTLTLAYQIGSAYTIKLAAGTNNGGSVAPCAFYIEGFKGAYNPSDIYIGGGGSSGNVNGNVILGVNSSRTGGRILVGTTSASDDTINLLQVAGRTKINGQLSFGGSTPTIAASTGAGTSPTVSIVGTNNGGVITVTTGTLPSTSATIVTVTYTGAFATGSQIVLYPTNANTTLLSGVSMVYTTGTTTTFTITSGTTALTAATTYSWSYHVTGY